MNWNKYFLYSDGDLIWKERRPEDHSTPRDCNRWNSRHAGKVTGCKHMVAKSKTAYFRVVLMSKWYLAHRIIWEMHHGEIPDGFEVDHINGDGTNNNICNLRLVSCEDNKKNRPIYSNNTSGFAGVNWDKKSKKWIARVSNKGVRIVVYRGSSRGEAVDKCLKERVRLKYHENHGRSEHGCG